MINDLKIEIECESCTSKYGNIDFNKKYKIYLCEFCVEELNSLVLSKSRKTKMREEYQ